MANIRKQAIISSVLVYLGFFIGAVNTYFFTRNGSFTPDQFGLTRIFYDLGQNIFIFGSLGLIPIMYKFYPYYKDNVEDKENDLLTLALTGSFIGFVLVLIAGYVLEPLVTKKYIQRAPLILTYYYLVFPFGFGMLFFSVLEAFCWNLHKTIVSNFLKETGMRIIVLILILLYFTKVVDFDLFIKLFSLVYLILFVIILIYLIRIKKFHLTLKISNPTKKFKKKMLSMWALIYGGVMIQIVAQTIDTFIIASLKGLGSTGVFNLAQYAANLVQVPQRSIQSITTGVISQAWKDKNYAEINRIYQRSCINLLLLATFIFGNIWLNINDAFTVFNIQDDYKAGIYVVFVLGIARLIDAGTGVNGTIIGTSVFWRFDFISGVVLLAFRIPITYLLIKKFGIIGSAFAELLSYTVYNAIRYEFLRRKFNMQPFTAKTGYSLIVAAIAFAISFFLFKSSSGILSIIGRTAVFSAVLIAGIFYLELTPDAIQLYYRFKEKWKPK
ncbi:MAG TPA: polysaccharide biosynthesis C-terminal domain-containing protein [Segetibacter sp.]|nr:polysaccharide biosynthesis C-terminal domain-containing protein [Segetibacter sp.]